MNNLLQYLSRIRAGYERLMEGRHGFDTLSGDLIIVWCITGFINGFVRSRIFSLAVLVFPIIAVLRMLSTNSVKRSAENRKYIKLRSSCAEFFKITYKRIKERKTHKYYKCSNCSSYLRVKRKKGEHTVVCPKCGKELHVKIR